MPREKDRKLQDALLALILNWNFSDSKFMKIFLLLDDDDFQQMTYQIPLGKL